MKAEDATVEQLFDALCGETMDGARIVHVSEGEVTVMDYEGRYEGTGATLKEALIQHGRDYRKNWPYDPEYDKVDFS